MNMYPACISIYNSNHEKQIILLTIPNGEEWHYLTVKKSALLLSGGASKHDGDFYCCNYLH